MYSLWHLFGELYDLKHDLAEANNLFGVLSEKSQELKSRLDARFAPVIEHRVESVEGEKSIPEELRRRLVGLGYL